MDKEIRNNNIKTYKKMKRDFIFAVMLLWPVLSFGQFSGEGSGTSSDPYLITNVNQLNEVRNYLSTAGVYFRLENDLDLTSFISENYPSAGWQPIGTSSAPFKGVFYGNCKTIKGLKINRPNQDYIGLFGDVFSGTVTQLMIVDCDINGNTAVAGVAGRIEGNAQVSQCGVIGKIVGLYAVGGIVGSESGSPSQSYFPLISDCYYNGDITAGNSSATTSAGGIVGYHFKSGITKCYAAGTIYSSHNVGGICGWFSNSGNLHPGYLTKCVAANTTLWGSNWTGRITGQYDNYSYVSGGNKAYSGMEIYFRGSTTPRDNVYDGCNSSNGTDNGSGISWGATMQKSTYTSMGWDFTNIWAIDEGESLPYFIWATIEPENPLLGDVNGDGEVNISDYTLLVDYLLSKTTDIVLQNSDVNQDDRINISDVTLIVDIILNQKR